MIVFFCIKCVYDTGGIYTELAQSKSIEVEIFVLFFSFIMVEWTKHGNCHIERKCKHTLKIVSPKN